MGTYEARATVDWEGFGGTVASASGPLATATAVRLTSAAGERDLRALVEDATEHCPVCQAIRGNVAMQVTASFDTA